MPNELPPLMPAPKSAEPAPLSPAAQAQINLIMMSAKQNGGFDANKSRATEVIASFVLTGIGYLVIGIHSNFSDAWSMVWTSAIWGVELVWLGNPLKWLQTKFGDGDYVVSPSSRISGWLTIVISIIFFYVAPTLSTALSTPGSASSNQEIQQLQQTAQGISGN